MPRHGFIHDDHERGIRVIAVVERPSLAETDVHRVEITSRDDAEMRPDWGMALAPPRPSTVIPCRESEPVSLLLAPAARTPGIRPVFRFLTRAAHGIKIHRTGFAAHERDHQSALGREPCRLGQHPLEAAKHRTGADQEQ